jgi:hypothetical protein
LHVRRGNGEAKLVRCSYGAIFDVIVDLRPASPTYHNWESFELSDDGQVTLFVPAGCAHGLQALTDPADVSYQIDRVHDPSEDVSIAFDDPELAIPWPLPVTVTSQRDRQAPPLAVATRLLAYAGSDLARKGAPAVSRRPAWHSYTRLFRDKTRRGGQHDRRVARCPTEHAHPSDPRQRRDGRRGGLLSGLQGTRLVTRVLIIVQNLPGDVAKPQAAGLDDVGPQPRAPAALRLAMRTQ